MRPPPRAMLTLLVAALALAAAPRRVAAREVATGGVQTAAVGDTGRAASQAAYFDPRPPVDCRALVFTGIAGDCNLDAGGTYDSCCGTLRRAEAARCFCDRGVVNAVRSVIGEAGLEYFRSFARSKCGYALTEGDACGVAGSTTASSTLGEREVTTLQQQQPGQQLPQQPGVEEEEEEDYEATEFPPFPPEPGIPPAPTAPPLTDGANAPEFPPIPDSEPRDLPPVPAFPAFPQVPSMPPEPAPPPPLTPPAPAPPPPLGTPGAAPQLSIPPPAPQSLGGYLNIPPPAGDPVRRKPPNLPSIWDKINDDKSDFQFGFFADAVVATGLKGLFQSAGPFTAFVPTNRAWYRALVSLGVTKEDVFEDPSLTEVIMHHIHRGEIYAEQMFFGKKVPTMHMSAPNVARSVRAALESGADPIAVRAMMTEGLEIETFQTMFRKMYYVDGCDVKAHSMDLVASNGVSPDPLARLSTRTSNTRSAHPILPICDITGDSRGGLRFVPAAAAAAARGANRGAGHRGEVRAVHIRAGAHGRGFTTGDQSGQSDEPAHGVRADEHGVCEIHGVEPFVLHRHAG